MSSFAWMIVITLILTAVGTGILLFVTLKYYWGVRGTPPPDREERRARQLEERKQRARQIEYAESHKWEARSQDFFDNSKR